MKFYNSRMDSNEILSNITEQFGIFILYVNHKNLETALKHSLDYEIENFNYEVNYFRINANLT